MTPIDHVLADDAPAMLDVQGARTALGPLGNHTSQVAPTSSANQKYICKHFICRKGRCTIAIA